MTRRFNDRPAAGVALLIAFLVITLFPLYWMLRTAITPGRDLFADNAGLCPATPR